MSRLVKKRENEAQKECAPHSAYVKEKGKHKKSYVYAYHSFYGRHSFLKLAFGFFSF